MKYGSVPTISSVTRLCISSAGDSILYFVNTKHKLWSLGISDKNRALNCEVRQTQWTRKIIKLTTKQPLRNTGCGEINATEIRARNRHWKLEKTGKKGN